MTGGGPDGPRRPASGDGSTPVGHGTPPSLREQLAQAERDEEWALIRLGGWAVLLVFIVAVLFLSPWPWGALVGLVFWAMGARGVHASFTEATARTRHLKAAVEGSRGGAEANE